MNVRCTWSVVRMVALAGGLLLSACATTPQGDRLGDKELASGDPSVMVAAAEIGLERKQYALAAKLLTEAARRADDESLADRATRVAYDHHQYSYVLTGAARWLQINPTSEEAHRFAGFAALRLYRIDIAVQHFDALLASAFISPQAGFMTLFPQWLQEGSRPATLALARQLAGTHAQMAEAQYVLAQAALQADNIELALTAAQRAVEISPYWTPARWLSVRVQLVNDQADAAIAAARGIVEQDGSAAHRLELAQILFTAGREEESRTALEALLKEPEAAAGAQRTLALMHMDRGQYDAAIKLWRDLVKAGRFVYDGMFYLGQITERRDATDDAIELYSRVTTGDMAMAAQTRAALLKAKKGKMTDGLAHLQIFAREHEDYAVEALAAQASLLTELGEQELALNILNEGLAEYPDEADLRVSKALLLERMKRSKQALAEMQRLASDRPDDPTALNMLGYTLVDRTRRTSEGFELVKKAHELMPDNGPVLDSMGWALHRLGRNEEALVYLQRASERVRDPEIALHVGEVQWAMGKRDQAQATWQAAFKLFPDSAELKERVGRKK